MKKLFAVLLALVSVMSFSACEDKDEKPSEIHSSAEETVKNNELEEAIKENYSASFEDFEFGVSENGAYTSNFGGIKFNAPENYIFSTREEILEMMNMGTEILDDDMLDMYSLVAQQTTVYDMLAKDAGTGDNVIVLYENLRAYGENAPDVYTAELYVDAMDTQFETMNTGIIYTPVSRENVTLAGKEFLKAEYSCQYELMGDVSMTQIYYVRKDGDYITGVIISTGFNEKSLSAEELEACFEAVDAE